MSYAKDRGSIIVKPGMLLDADAFKIGNGPLATLHDPATGEQYVMGYNHPAVIPGCVGLWTFDEKNTSTLYDRSEEGNNLTGTSIDASLYKDTIFGVGYDFPGAADYFSIADNASISPTKQITVEVVISIDTVSGTLIAVRKESSYIIQIESGIAHGYIYDGAAQKDITGATTLSINTWYHVALTYDGSTIKVFLNGKLDGSLVYSGDIDDTADALFLGAASGPAGLFDGKIASIRICSRALKPHEFMHHWYFNTLVNGNFNSDGAVLFDPTISAFKARKIFTVQADWDSRGQMRSSNIIVNNVRGEPDESFVPMQNDPSKLIVGGLPLVDDNTVGMWIPDGSLNEDGKVIDLSKEANHGTLVSLADADLVNSRFGKYYDLDGAADYISNTSLSGHKSDKITIEALAIPDVLITEFIVSFGEADTGKTRGIRISSSNWGMIAYGGSSTEDWNDIVAADQGKWAYVVGTWDGTSLEFFLNGVSQGTATRSGVVTPSGSDLQIGSAHWSTDYWNGQIAFVRVSNVIRGTDWIAHMAQCLHRANAQFQDLLLPRGE